MLEYKELILFLLQRFTQFGSLSRTGLVKKQIGTPSLKNHIIKKS
ncbi:hypothetical protein [Anaerotignum propionicum]|nr:hypothetical protein [Anaerotignum propionicum]